MRKLALLFSLLLLFACEKIPQTAQEQYRKGMEATKRRKWGKATLFLEKALEGELSPRAKEQATLALADAYFSDGNCEGAVIHYEEFLELYPASPGARKALLRVGICYLDLTKGPEWDQTFARKALSAFEEFLKRYPDDPEVETARRYRHIARSMLAEHEIYIAGTYDMVHKFVSSIKRYEEIMKNYKDVVSKERLEYLLGRAYYFTTVQAEEEIDRLWKELKKEKKRAKSTDAREREVARNKIELLKKDIAMWQELARKNRVKGEEILRKLLKEHPGSPYAVKARRILSGEKLLEVEEVKSPIKRSLWWKLKETF
jgi:outer membrane protein assembly factor BamD